MLLDNSKKQNKQKTKDKHFLKGCIEQFFSFFIQKYHTWQNKLLFDAAKSVQKKKCGRVQEQRKFLRSSDFTFSAKN